MLFLLLILLVLLKLRPHFDILVSVYDERYDCQLVGDVSFGSIGMTRRDALWLAVLFFLLATTVEVVALQRVEITPTQITCRHRTPPPVEKVSYTCMTLWPPERQRPPTTMD